MRVAPLKRQQFLDHFRIVARTFHSRMRVAPLKRGPVPSDGPASLPFHSRMRVAPLKQSSVPFLSMYFVSFHSPMRVAPLKRAGADRNRSSCRLSTLE